MKTIFKGKIVGIAMLLCFVLAGCSRGNSGDYTNSDYGKEEASEYTDKGLETSNYVSNVKTVDYDTDSGITEGDAEDIIADMEDDTAFLNESKDDWGKRRITSTDQLTIKDITAKNFQIDIDMGDINVSYGNTDTATINVKYTASGKKKKVLTEILQTVGLDYSMKKDTLQVSIVNKNTKENIWNWLRDKYRYNLYVEMDITLPESVNKFNIDNSLGNTSLHSVKGSFDIHNALGDVDLNKINFVGESEIKADLGKIECSLSKEIKESSEVTMDNSLGEILIDTNSLPYAEHKQVNSDDYWKESASKTILINKLCEMKLNVDLGEIIVQ